MHMQENPDNQEGIKIGDVTMSPNNRMENPLELWKKTKDILEDSYNQK